MDPPETADLDYLLGVGAPPAAPAVPSAVAPAVPSGVPVVPLPPVPPSGTGSASTNTAGGGAPTGSEGGGANPKKRPLEDKKARDRKRVLRNRELARVSNERRKGRIKAMENDLTETRQTVSTLEESIRCLEAENKELRNLLQGKTGTDGVPPVAPPPPSSAPGASPSVIPPGASPSVIPPGAAQ